MRNASRPLPVPGPTSLPALALAALLGTLSSPARSDARSDDIDRPASLGGRFLVHEWGTFTTLASSSGRLLEGLYVDETRLPAFVHGLPFFNYGAAGWPSPERLKGVTVKMETPVLYFHSDGPREVTAEVRFAGGTISQWYPQRQGGEADPAGPVVDLSAAPRQGSILWRAKVLDKRAARAYTSPRDQETPEWTAPRNVDANLVEGREGEVEKFLFYRGLGNFPMSVTLKFLEDGRLAVRNGGADTVPYLQVYDRTHSDHIGPNPVIWWEGPLAPGETRVLAKPDPQSHPLGQAAMERLREAMVAAGLFRDEAQALLNTWYDGYFREGGLKAFWILPRRQVDVLLPLTVTPVPDEVARVIIGRSEILTPEFEAALVAEGGSLPSREDDKYYLAYLDFLARRGEEQALSARSPSPGSAAPAGARPWRLVLPWEGLSAAGGSRRVDLRGRALAP